MKAMQYKITMTVRSKVVFDDLTFRQYHFQTLKDDDKQVEITREIGSKDWKDALSVYNEELWPILDAIAFEMGSAISAYGADVVVDIPSKKQAILLLRREAAGITLRLPKKHTGERRH
jgi:hypothetical protein